MKLTGHARRIVHDDYLELNGRGRVVARVKTKEEEMPTKKKQTKQHVEPRITRVHYDRRFNTGNYENRRIGVEADVPEGSNPMKALAYLAAWVDYAHENGLDEAREQNVNIDDTSSASEALATLDHYARAHGKLRRGWQQARELIKQLLELE